MMNKRIKIVYLGLVPAYLMMLITLILPIFIVIAVSFSTRGVYGGFDYIFTTDSYRSLLYTIGWSNELEFDPQYIIVSIRTLLLSLATTIICFLLAFPVAYYISLQKTQRKMQLVWLITLPFWVSMIVRIYAWTILLGHDGLIQRIVYFLGLIDSNGNLLFNNGAMLVGMVYSYIPLMILPIFASVEKLDRTLIEASHDLYGGRFVCLRKVILPLCKPGIIAGSILVFVPSLGVVLEPMILGGGKDMTMGSLIQLQFGAGRNWPLGSAIAIVLMVGVIFVLLLQGLRSIKDEKRITG